MQTAVARHGGGTPKNLNLLGAWLNDFDDNVR
jgi:hypothetical protein